MSKQALEPEAAIRDLLRNPRSGPDIEARSFEIIDKEAPPHKFTPDQWQVVRRMIHTAGDFGIIDAVRFSPGAIDAAVRALRAGSPIYLDSNMAAAGLSLERLRSACPGYSRRKIFCHIADPDVAEEARQMGLPRSLFAVRKARPLLGGGIAAFGNAPVALLELNRMIIEEGLRPAFVIAAPVGFVNVEESKSELAGLGVPFIAIAGRRGGSTLAVSIVHALCTIASAGKRQAAATQADSEAIILLGHGSRVLGAGEDMEQVALRVRDKAGLSLVETCSMQMLGPKLADALDKCVEGGARRVIVIPYFLHVGVHMREDIPELLREEVRRRPGIEIILGKNLGYDESLADLVVRRIEESRGLPAIAGASEES
ncbi:MAG: precorrin-8X methylmutase [Syntrophaceae bacterium]